MVLKSTYGADAARMDDVTLIGTTNNGDHTSNGTSSLNNNGYSNGSGHIHTTASNTHQTNGNAHQGNSKPHPFVYKLYPTQLDKLIWLLMAVTIAPIKLLFMIIFLVLAWIPAVFAVAGWPIDSLVPFTGWRVILKDISVFFVRCAWFSAGITHLTIKGRQVSSKEAPIIVMGPHSSMVDTLAGAICGFPGVVSVIDNARIPVAGTLFRVNQSIFVQRGDPDSRRKAAEEIQRRAAGNWPQLVIFPEGTCCNRSCLLPYKAGAFIPGVAIQPLTIKYPNRLDTTTWVNTGPGLLSLFTLLLATPFTRMEVEYHAVYRPTEEEKHDPELYMINFRQHMSRLLGIPPTDYSYSHLMELVKTTRPNRGPTTMWSKIFRQGYIEMPEREKIN